VNVSITKRARRDVEALPDGLRQSVDEAILRIAGDPWNAGKRLRGSLRGRWSYPVREYRVIYRIEGEGPSVSIAILAVSPRETAYPRTRH
jgi:mRNA-degrading endonuclease RelE of RelBE toxin-antitoxin system